MTAKASMRRRPALWTALGFGLGIALGRTVDIALEPVAVGCAMAWLCAGLMLYRDARCAGWALGVVVVLLGVLRYQVDTALSPLPHMLGIGVFGQRGVVSGRIVEEPERGDDRVRFVVALEKMETDSAIYHLAGQALVTVKVPGFRAGYGDRVSLKGRLRRPHPARNPGAFDYRAFLAQQDIYSTLYIGKAEQVVAIERLPGYWLDEQLVLPVRGAVREAIERNLAGAPAGLLLGLLLGEKRRIPEEVREAFRGTGLAHALVVSGLHVGLVAGFFFFGFRFLRLSDRGSSAATILVLVLYALLTDTQVPVVRAAVMGTVVLLGRILGRQGDVYNTLGLAALLILVIWPESPWSLSFQLSFGATWAIVALHKPLTLLFPEAWRREGNAVRHWIVSPLCASLAAQLGTGPLIAYAFGQLAPVSLAANLVVAPLLAVVLGLGVLAALTGWILPWVAMLFNAANYLVIVTLLELVELLAALPFAAVEVPRPGGVFLVCCAILCLLGPRLPDSQQAQKAAVFVVLLGLNVSVWTYALRPRDLDIYFLDVGQGDAAFLRFPNGKTMVVDGGERSERFDYGARVLVPFLRHMGIGRVDVVVASHPHNDHIGGLVALLQQVEVGHFVDGGQRYDSWTARRIRELVAERGVRYHRVAAGDSLVGLGGVGGLILHPNEEFVDTSGESPGGLNNGSVAFRLDYGEVNVLFTGDLEEETDGAILAWGPRLAAQLLKVAHHGSRTSSQSYFVEAVSPTLAIMSLGFENKFKHPAPEVVARYMEHGARVLRTDRTGAVRVRIDGVSMAVETMIE
ncbi:MAG: DNA internalization-related competence protein ComEC/Rec2 [Gemmatimonadetes bacterium]|jgi:competence protein ComEC|nr:DNA internalization-related competence protein ComEC/Rec2 [Gemmatimonadota bacterium]MBT7585899.1 DNA internalization-related competence protein ComEC/Rec2 [Gemmatimonadota bacterium]